MSTVLQLRRGTKAQHVAFTGSPGEVTVVSDDNTLRVHDGVTPGGNSIGPGFGVPSIFGRSGSPNAATPATKFDVTASRVTTVSANGKVTNYTNVGTKTVDITIQGLGGRDQAGAFGNFAEPNLFYVPDGAGGLGVVASLNSIFAGPIGYTEWAPIMNHKLNGGAQFYQGDLVGNQFLLRTLTTAVNGSASPFPTSNSYANYAPLGAAIVLFQSSVTASSGSGSPMSATHNLSESSTAKYTQPIYAVAQANAGQPLGPVPLANLPGRTVYTGYSGASGLQAWLQSVYVAGWIMGF